MADESADESSLQGRALKGDDELDELLDSKLFPCAFVALDRFSLSVCKADGNNARTQCGLALIESF